MVYHPLRKNFSTRCLILAILFASHTTFASSSFSYIKILQEHIATLSAQLMPPPRPQKFKPWFFSSERQALLDLADKTNHFVRTIEKIALHTSDEFCYHAVLFFERLNRILCLLEYLLLIVIVRVVLRTISLH